MEVSSDDNILRFAIKWGPILVYHALARKVMAGIHCSAGNCLQRAALTTSFMCQMAKVDIRKACLWVYFIEEGVGFRTVVVYVISDACRK